MHHLVESAGTWGNKQRVRRRHIKQVCNGSIFARSVHVWLCFVGRLSLGSEIHPCSRQRPLPPPLQVLASLHRDSAQIAMLFVAWEKNNNNGSCSHRPHIFFLQPHLCNYLSQSRTNAFLSTDKCPSYWVLRHSMQKHATGQTCLRWTQQQRCEV